MWWGEWPGLPYCCCCWPWVDIGLGGIEGCGELIECGEGEGGMWGIGLVIPPAPPPPPP